MERPHERARYRRAANTSFLAANAFACMWGTHVRRWSRRKPRKSICLADGIRRPFNERATGWCQYLLRENNIKEVFPELIDSSTELAQVLTMDTMLWSFLVATDGSLWDDTSVMSSAYAIDRELRSTGSSRTSSTRTSHKKGERTLPWGQPVRCGVE